MKNNRRRIASIFQVAVGLLAIVAFVVIALSGENMTKWIITLILSIAFVIMGILGIVESKSSR